MPSSCRGMPPIRDRSCRGSSPPDRGAERAGRETMAAASVWNVEIDGGLALLTFVRPPANWMSLAAMTELGEHLEALAGRTGDVKVVVLTGGVDGYFIDHADLDD